MARHERICEDCGRLFGTNLEDRVACRACHDRREYWAGRRKQSKGCYRQATNGGPSQRPRIPGIDGRRKLDRWSIHFDCCKKCGGIDREHEALGLCRRCYPREIAERSWRPTITNKPRENKVQALEPVVVPIIKPDAPNRTTILDPLVGECRVIREYELDGETVLDVQPVKSRKVIRGLPLQGCEAA